MEIHAIISRLENMLHHVVGLGTYKTDILEAIKQLRVYSNRLEYEESSGYRNSLDLANDSIKDLNDRIDILEKDEERWHNLAVKRNEELGKLWEMYYELKESIKKRDIITICGSMKYWDDMVIEYTKLTQKGFCVFMPIHDGQFYNREFLKHLHFKKIAVSSKIIVVNPDGYIGEDTKEEISFAKSNNIPIFYTTRIANNPQNFCGNCRYCKIDPNEGTAVCTHSRVITYWLDPDAASCCYFESNQVDKVDVCKPEFPCCNHEDCDDCALCPF